MKGMGYPVLRYLYSTQRRESGKTRDLRGVQLDEKMTKPEAG